MMPVLEEKTGIEEIFLTPCGTGDEETCTIEEIEQGGIFIVPEITLFVRPAEKTKDSCRLEQVVGNEICKVYDVPAGITEWRGRISLFRGGNNFRFCGFGVEDYELYIYHRTWLSEIVVSIVRALILLIILQTFIVQTYQIPSSSMESTFLPGDYVLVEKITPFLERLHRGDIVVFEFPCNFMLDFVKRIVALAGDEVILNNRQLYINGKPVNELLYAQYRSWKPFGLDNRNRSFGPVVVPDDACMVFGDNRDNSYDSRSWGALPQCNICGRPWLIYWPPSRAGFIKTRHVFTHDNNADSQATDYAPERVGNENERCVNFVPKAGGQ